MSIGSLGSTSGFYASQGASLSQMNAASSTGGAIDDGNTGSDESGGAASGAAAGNALTGGSKAAISGPLMAMLTQLQEQSAGASDTAPAQNAQALPDGNSTQKLRHAPIVAAIAAQKAQAGVVRDDTASLKALRAEYKSGSGDEADRADLKQQIAAQKAQKQSDVAEFQADKAIRQADVAALKALKAGQ